MTSKGPPSISEIKGQPTYPTGTEPGVGVESLLPERSEGLPRPDQEVRPYTTFTKLHKYLLTVVTGLASPLTTNIHLPLLSLLYTTYYATALSLRLTVNDATVKSHPVFLSMRGFANGGSKC
jgi:hypothetical protein